MAGKRGRSPLIFLDLSKLPEHVLKRIAAGEHPLSVLASVVQEGAVGPK